MERANREILDVLLSVVNGLLEYWEDWPSRVAASMTVTFMSTGRIPYFILYGVERDFRLTN